jgi:oligosaccharide 4-alpha-D-glucosyltransferase
MLARLKDRGVNTVIISQPYVLKNGKAIDNYNELSPRGMFCRDSVGNTHDVTIWVGTGGMFDVSNPDTREWLRNRYKLLTDEGVGGWWGDLGEPEVHPETIYHYNGLTAREYHNLYGNEWSRIIYDLYKEEYPETRLMTLMRGGTAGLQRYSVFPWSTDVSRSWGGLQPQVTIMINSGLSGLGYMSHDVGGFAITEDKVVDPELYVRWLQLGTFSPILRTHAQQVAEPYRYTEQQDIILDLIKTRYRWLPYNYTLAYENASQGLPMVRPLNFYSQSSTQYDDIEDQYFWGSDVMIAPVLEQGAVARRVVIPDGQWIDYNNPLKIYNGGDTISYDAPLGVLPMFVKAGALIPQADYAMGNTGDYRVDNYTIKYFPVEGVGSEYTLFEDDCKSATSLEKDEYSLITFSGLETSESYEIKVSNEGTYTGAPTQKQLTFVIYNVDSKPRQVVVDGKKLRGKAVKYNAEASTLTITFDWTVSANTSLLVVK